MNKDAMLAEIAAYLDRYPIMQEGDVTARDICAMRPGMREKTAYTIMDQLERTGEWEKMRVVKSAGSERWFWVIRKKSPAG